MFGVTLSMLMLFDSYTHNIFLIVASVNRAEEKAFETVTHFSLALTCEYAREKERVCVCVTSKTMNPSMKMNRKLIDKCA